MAALGAKYKWLDGKILHASRLWKAPTMRRIPRILIEDRALEVGIKMYLEEPWITFEETKDKAGSIDIASAIPLDIYLSRYHLLPSQIKGKDTYKWLKENDNALLVWGVNNKYYVKPIKK